FQAEDGIRDRTVTGVQTCALPIYTSHIGRPKCHYDDKVIKTAVELVTKQGLSYRSASARMWRLHAARIPFGTIHNWVESRYLQRSEERRVGKECRDRGGGDEHRDK